MSDDLSCYRERRERLAGHLGEGAVALIPTAPTRQRNRDCDFPYRPDSYFFYLSGFTEPDAWLLLRADGHSTLFCQPRDPDMETWTGYRLGPDAAPEALGVDHALPVTELDEQMPALLDGAAALWYPFATHAGLEPRIQGWLSDLRDRSRRGARVPAVLRDACTILDEMRLIKDEHEIAVMRRAAAISAGAHTRAMQCSARMLRAGADLREYHLEAELLHEFRRCGAQFPAYTSIVAAGANACVLHYPAGDAAIRDQDLVLIDAACELDGYASDITRSFPANGRFTGPQRALYELVLASQEAAIAVTRAGQPVTAPHQAALEVLAQGMLDLGLLDRKQHGSLQDVLENRAYMPFYMHNTSHWMGMDVHDCGSYQEPGQELAAEGKPPARILRPGMVLTLEPGIYVRSAPGVPEQFRDIGIRIEDDAVVTDGACELLTRDVPVAAREIEALMQA